MSGLLVSPGNTLRYVWFNETFSVFIFYILLIITKISLCFHKLTRIFLFSLFILGWYTRWSAQCTPRIWLNCWGCNSLTHGHWCGNFCVSRVIYHWLSWRCIAFHSYQLGTGNYQDICFDLCYVTDQFHRLNRNRSPSNAGRGDEQFETCFTWIGRQVSCLDFWWCWCR